MVPCAAGPLLCSSVYDMLWGETDWSQKDRIDSIALFYVTIIMYTENGSHYTSLLCVGRHMYMHNNYTYIVSGMPGTDARVV